MNVSYYKPSGRILPIFVLYFILIILITIPVLSLVYIHLIYYIKFVYLRFFITIFCGMALGFLTGFAAKPGKTRNPGVVKVFAVVAVCLMKYVQWCVYIPLVLSETYGIYVLTFGERLDFSLSLFLSPVKVYEWVLIINEKGAWGTRSFGAATGVFLAIIWILELILMAVSAAFVALIQPSFPFSEETGGWYTKMAKKIDADRPEDFDDMKRKLESGEYADFVQCVTAKRTNYSSYMTLTFYQPPHVSANEPYYMDVEYCVVEKKKKNQVKTWQLITYLAINAHSVSEITNTNR